ncbi:MAG: hypothetical protein AAGG01_15370 [Planctomycetota bacterium]
MTLLGMGKGQEARTPAQRALGLGAAGMISALALGGCRTASVATQNLDAVLSSTDSFRYRAAITGVWTDLYRSSFGALRSLGVNVGPGAEAEVKDVRNPSKVALENLIELAESTEGNRAWLHNEQVRTFARYATSAPSQLCRERAQLELVPHAQRLGIDQPYTAPETAANQAELRQALEGLVDATRRIVAEGGEVSTTARADFDAAIVVLEETQLDVSGGSRLLRAIGPFFKSRVGTGLPTEQRERLQELSIKVQGEMIREALYAGVVDRSDTVRAAGMRSNIAVYGEDFALEALFALVPRQMIPDPVQEAYSRFGVPQVPVEFTDTFLAVFDAFERSGLPFAAKKPSALGIETRGSLFATCWQICINDLMFTDRARHGAMRALEATSQAGLSTYRSEEWDAWFRTVGPALEKELRALRASEEGPSGAGAGADAERRTDT